VYKKLFKLSSINILTGIINFLSTILIVKMFGLNIFGEFAIFNAYLAIITLSFIIIPPNFSVTRLQDDNDFNNILTTAYLLCNISIIIILFILYYFYNNFFGLDINLWVIILSILMKSFFNLIDIQSQAKNKLQIYFKYLLFQSFFKVIIIGLIFYYFNQYNLNLLIISFVLPQFLIFLFHIFYFKSEFLNIKIDIKKMFLFLVNNFYLLKNYYIEIILKRTKENIIILFFSNFLSKEIIGLYSLLLKVGTFVLSQVRIIEAFFMNKKNLQNSNLIDNKIYLLSFLFQILIIIVGLIYFKLTIGAYKIQLLLIYSFITYPYLNIIIRRNKLYNDYNNKPIIYSLLLSIITVTILYSIFYIFKYNSIYSIVLTVLMSETILSSTLIYFFNKFKNVN
jgi:hypothetical protein